MNVGAEHVELAETLARKFVLRLPQGVDEDAYRGAALEALAKAAASYDPSRGQTFRTYAAMRMWYAMQDEVRLLSRNTRAAWRAAQMGETQVVRGREIPFITQCSLDAPVAGDDGSSISLGETLPASDDIARTLEAAEMRRHVAELPPRERFIFLARSYGYTRPEIAKLLGVTDSRISQLQARALRRVA